MRMNVAGALALISLLALSACGKSGEINVRKPMPGKAPNLLQGLPSSLQAEHTLSEEFLDKPAAGTPSTPKPSLD